MLAAQSAAMALAAQRGTPRTPLGSKRYHRTPQWPRNPPIARNFRPRSHIRNLRNSRKVSIVYESASLSCTTPLSAPTGVCASSLAAVTPEHPSHTRLTPPSPGTAAGLAERTRSAHTWPQAVTAALLRLGRMCDLVTVWEGIVFPSKTTHCHTLDRAASPLAGAGSGPTETQNLKQGS